MKKLLALLAIFLALPLVATAQGFTKITFTWTNPVYPVCSATVTTWCLTGATMTDTTANVVASSTIPAGAATYTYTPTGGIPFGYVHGFSLVLNAVDGNGNPIVSPSATTTLTNAVLGAPTGLTATANSNGTVALTWTNPVVQSCSSTVTTWCAKAITITDTTTNTVISSTVLASATTYTYTQPGGIAFGYVHTFSVVVNAVDGSGNPVVSGVGSATATYSNLNPPTGFTATVQ